MVDGSVGVVGF